MREKLMPPLRQAILYNNAMGAKGKLPGILIWRVHKTDSQIAWKFDGSSLEASDQLSQLKFDLVANKVAQYLKRFFHRHEISADRQGRSNGVLIW